MPSFLDLITGPLSHPFMVRGLLAAVLVGVVCAILGTYVVLRGMAFLGDALAHSILPGVAVGYLMGSGARGPLFWWAMAAGIIAALGIGTVSRQGEIKEDTAIGVIFAGMLALGVALISTARGYSVDLAHFMFGDVLGVGPTDLVRIGVFGALVLATVFAFYKEFLVLSFDPILAATLRLPTRFLHYLLLIILAVTIVISLQAVGLGLVVAMLVTPAATALLLTRRLPAMMAVSAAVGGFSAILGLYLSYYANIASGAAIVLVATAFFILAFLLAPSRGVLARTALRRA